MDIVPGRYTYAYIEPTLEGQYRLSCNEYCGTGHSKMKTMCEVHPDEKHRKDNTKWIKRDHAPWENGKRIYQIQCSGCHKVNGEAATGPALNLPWGRNAEFIKAPAMKVDENYIRESILYPEKKIVAGYGPVSKMNSFKGILSETQGADGSESDLDAVIAYLKKINEESGSAK
jgi:cytochrome c oxidase subunit 2